MFKSPYLNCSSILLSPLSMHRLTNWRTLSRLSKQVLNTHTHKKKDEGDLSSSKSQLQGAEKDMDQIKTAMGLQENTKKWSTSRTKADGTIAQSLEYKNRRAGCAKWLNRKSEIKDMVSFKV